MMGNDVAWVNDENASGCVELYLERTALMVEMEELRKEGIRMESLERK